MPRTRQGTKIPLPSPGYGQGRQLAAIQNVGGGIGAPPTTPPSPEQRARMVDAANTPVGERVGVFGPTQRPDEPITAGLSFGPGPVGRGDVDSDPMLALQAMASLFPGNPAILRLMIQE